VALTAFANTGMAETATHKKMFSATNSLRFFSMFKPLYKRKNAVKIPFSPLENPEKIIHRESGFFALFAIGKNPVSG
jgi:hypothetical protein